jgi:hypothetical protein
MDFLLCTIPPSFSDVVLTLPLHYHLQKVISAFLVNTSYFHILNLHKYPLHGSNVSSQVVSKVEHDLFINTRSLASSMCFYEILKRLIDILVTA